MPTQLCPCQSTKPFSLCCEPLLIGIGTAQTAEALMRSRYTAYTLHNSDYLSQTWHPSTRPEGIDTSLIPNWLSLTVKNCHAGGAQDTEGTVEFIAIGQAQNRVVTLHEISIFLKEDGQWLYLTGNIREPDKAPDKLGRNAPCSCGSGKKFKKCCNK